MTRFGNSLEAELSYLARARLEVAAPVSIGGTMLTEFYLEVMPDEAELVRAVVKKVIKEVRKKCLPIESETLATRLIECFSAGERNFDRLTAVVLGPEAASARLAN